MSRGYVRGESLCLPGEWAIYWIRANLKAIQGNIKEAFRDFAEAVDILKESPEAKENKVVARMFGDRAMLLFQQGFFDDAEKDFSLALKIYHENPYIMANYGYILASRDKNKEAFEQFQKALRIFHGSGIYKVIFLDFKEKIIIPPSRFIMMC